MPEPDDTRTASGESSVSPEQEALVSFLRGAVGDNLRTVLQYDDDSATLLYARADAVAEDSRAEMRAFVEDLRAAEPRERRRAALHNVGDHHATVRVYDESVLVHFPRAAGVGTLVTLDPAAASSLGEFLDACRRQLDGSARSVPDESGG